jgi:hypothetical protein
MPGSSELHRNAEFGQVDTPIGAQYGAHRCPQIDLGKSEPGSCLWVPNWAPADGRRP